VCQVVYSVLNGPMALEISSAPWEMDMICRCYDRYMGVCD
jgi:hypothetical protein